MEFSGFSWYFEDFYISMIPTTGTNFKKIHEMRVTCPGWFNIELPNEAFFTLSNHCYDYSKNVFYPFSWQQLSGKHIPFTKIMQPISQTDKDYWRKFVTKLYFVTIARDQNPRIRIKIHQTIFLLLPLFALYLRIWMWSI